MFLMPPGVTCLEHVTSGFGLGRVGFEIADATTTAARTTTPAVARELHAITTAAPATQRARLAELFAKEPLALEQAEWHELADIVSADTTNTIARIPRELSPGTSLERMARAMGDGQRGENEAIDHFFALGRMTDVPTDTRAATARALLARPAADLDRSEWRSLASIVQLDTTHEIVDMPRSINGRNPFVTIARKLADTTSLRGGTRPQVPTDITGAQSYLDVWKTSQLPAADRRAALDAIVAKPPASLARSEWKQLADIIDSDTARSIVPVPDLFTNMTAMSQIARRTGDGIGPVDRQAQRWFDAVRMSDRPVAERTALAESLLARNAADLSTDDWRTLMALIDSDPAHSIVDLPTKLAKQYSLEGLADTILGGSHDRIADAQLYFDEWHSTHTAEFRTQVSNALATLGASDAPAEAQTAAKSFLRTPRGNINTAVATLPTTDRLRYAALLLERVDPYGASETRVGLSAARDALAGASELTGTAAAIRDETRTLIDRNLARIDGGNLPGAIEGYRRIVDMSEIGAVRSNLELLELFTRTSATTVASGATAAHTAARAADVITW